MLARFVLAAVLLAAAACSRQPPPAKSQPLPRVEAPRTGAGQDKTPDPGGAAAPEERLARQESGTRMFEQQVLDPPRPSRLPIPAPLPREREPAPPNAAAAPENRPPAAPAPARAAPPPSAAPAAPPLETAAIAPSSPPPAPRAGADAEWKLLARVEPRFPREALQAGVDRGTVRARVTIDAAGYVTRVDVIDSRPRRVFDRAVVRALSQWKFSGGADGRTLETEIYFHR
jgi:protein TonB